MNLFTRTAYQLKNGSRRTVLATRALAESLQAADPITWRYARITPVEVSWLRPGFGQVETFPTRGTRSGAIEPTPDEAESLGMNITRKRGRPTNAERAARAALGPVRGIAPAVPTEASTDSSLSGANPSVE